MENQNILNFVNQEEILALQKISNHSTNTNIERYVAVYGVNIMGGDVKRTAYTLTVSDAGELVVTAV